MEGPVKIALVQLPLQSHDYVYSEENIPLAAGYLAAYLHDVGSDAEVFICPETVMNLGGDAAVLHWIEGVRPHIAGFSCYLWNVERTLALCSRIRERLEGCIVVLGGPEINTDNGHLLDRGQFHYGIVGEGEETFHELVRSVARGLRSLQGIPGIMARERREADTFRARGHMGSLDDVPSPYLEGLLKPSLRRTMLLETVRGCPMRCTYCYYHKSSPQVRAFSEERVGREIAWARRNSVDELTLIDPCFIRRSGLGRLLDVMARERQDTLRFSCELNAEDITEDLLLAMLKAGLSHVEIGLQSTNRKALRNIGRFFDEAAFIRGVRMLRREGVRVMTDVMAGLPGDTLDDVKRTIDFVLGNDLCDDLSVYPLSVLPGTALRRQARRFGIEFLREPPYLVTSSRTMTRDDMVQAFAYAEEASGRDLFPVELPFVAGSRGQGKGTVVRTIVLDGPGGCTTLDPEALGQALCMEVRDPVWMERPDLGKRLKDLLDESPYSLVSWIVPERMYRHGSTAAWIRSVSPCVRHITDREYMSPFTPERSVQLFVESRTSQGGLVYTMIPMDDDPSRPLWASLPEDAPADEEHLHGMRMESLLGYRPTVRYFDRQDRPADAMDGHLGAVTLSW